MFITLFFAVCSLIILVSFGRDYSILREEPFFFYWHILGLVLGLIGAIIGLQQILNCPLK